MSRKDVPPYPEANDSLMNVGLWPKTRVFDGATYVQEFSASRSDIVDLNLASLAGIDSGWDYGSHYVTYLENGRRSGARGPSYHWRSDSTLAERSYATSKWVRTWCYTKKGDFYQYSFKERPNGVSVGYMVIEGASYDSLISAGSEYFERDGSLVGFTISNSCYWMGTKMEPEEWKHLFLDWWLSSR